MKILDILNEERLLLEAGIRLPKEAKSAKILHHDDFDGVMSAVAIGLQLKKQGVTNLLTDTLHDSDNEFDQEVKLAKRKGQILIVVDFDRFKGKSADLAKKNVDVQSDHHEKNDPDEKNTDKKSVQTKYGSDVLHISATKAQGFITGSDLKIMTGIDSAKFGKNLSTNIFLQRELKKKDSANDKRMRLAIITSSILGQLVRSKASRNPGAVKSIIKEVMKAPTVITFYSSVMKHVKLQKTQVQLLKAYEGKENGEVDWAAIEKYNQSVTPEMRIGKDRMGQVKKSPATGRSEAASAEELGKRNKEGQAARELNVDAKGNKSLKSQDAGDADMPPWTAKDKFSPISKMAKSKAWADAEKEAEEKHENGTKGKKGEVGNALPWWKLSASRKKELTVAIWKVKMNDLQKETPKILRKTANVSQQNDFKGNRYLAYEDPKIVANIRDFWKFWQMAMRPDYYEKMSNAAKKHGKEFNAEEIDLVKLGKAAMDTVKKKMFTVEELKKRGFDNPEEVLKVLNKQFDVAKAKSGGHKGITNIDLNPIYGPTADKYAMAVKRAKKLGEKKGGSEKLKTIETKMAAKSKLFGTLLRNFKEGIQTELSNVVQGKVDTAKKDLTKVITKDNPSLKDSIVKNAGVKKSPERKKLEDKLKEINPTIKISPEASDTDLKQAVTALTSRGSRGFSAQQQRALGKELADGTRAKRRRAIGDKK